MVLPKYCLDSYGKTARCLAYSMGAKLYAAYRLPDDCFTNAKVTVDLVFFQKFSDKPRIGDNGWCHAPYARIGVNKHRLNQHFIQHSEHIIGTLTDFYLTRYNRMELTCKRNGNLFDQMAQRLKALPAPLMQPSDWRKQTIQQVINEAEWLLKQLK